jgi:hypothetical protein
MQLNWKSHILSTPTRKQMVRRLQPNLLSVEDEAFMRNPFDLTNSEDAKHELLWHVHDASETKGVTWSVVAAHAEMLLYNYNYLAYFIQERNRNYGWYLDTTLYHPLPIPTPSEFVDILKFRKSELTRILDGTHSALDLYEKLEHKCATASTFSQGTDRWNEWHWPAHWRPIPWNTSIAGGAFYYRADPDEYIRLQERLNQTQLALDIQNMLLRDQPRGRRIT